MSFTDRHPLNWLLQQFQLKPGKPNISSGLRSLFILSVPVAVGIITSHAAASAIATMAAWFVGMVNVDGTYRQRATAMIAATIGTTVVFLIASLVSSHLWLAVPTTFLVIFVTGLAGLYGSVAASVGSIVSIAFVVSLARFASFSNWSTLIQHCALCLAGGTWTTVLSLGLWAVLPDVSPMQKVADCYLSLSKFAGLASERALNPKDLQEWAQRFLQAQDTVIQDMTSARSIWTTMWTVQKGANLRENHLLLLIEDVNKIVNSVAALSELLAIASEGQLFSQLQKEIQQGIEQLALALQMLSKAIAKGKNFVDLGDLDRTIEALEYQWQVLRTQIRNQIIKVQTEEYSEVVNLRKITVSLTNLAQQIHTDAELVTDLRQGKPLSIAQGDISPPAQSERTSIIDILRNNFTFDSVLFRHALRLALITTFAELLASLLQLPRGYWITLTALVALKPNFGGTSETTVQRVIGTILGGIIGMALVLLIKNPLAIAVCFLVLVFAAMSVRALSYSLFITLLTPAIVVLLNVISAGGWKVGVLRIFDSLVGGVLALLGSYLLFPSWERQQLPVQLEKTIRANLAYFQQVIANYLHLERNGSANSINTLRYQAALENINATAAAERLFSEPRHVRGEIEPVMTLMIYIRGFFSSVTTLAEHLREFSGEYQFTELKRLADTIVRVLENLADALVQRQRPQELPALDIYLEAIHDQIAQLHAARLSEIAKNSNTLTPTLQAVREQTPLSIELDRIVNEIKVMHCVITRLQQ
ncbi:MULTISPECIES: FUSC family protein [Nostocales]|uniref:FUSC family protein n=3 Tax=Nostocales TaxID=1161 RepID=A0A0C1NDT6_9CYAN|nr:FUSC family protein [Tolypothrix bouteillei]KAF3886966.1 FUSC family protein [Tolypothrix bouteillei VB521301]